MVAKHGCTASSRLVALFGVPVVDCSVIISFTFLPCPLLYSASVRNQQNMGGPFIHAHGTLGSLTTDSQKLSMLFTTFRNPSRSTGLVM